MDFSQGHVKKLWSFEQALLRRFNIIVKDLFKQALLLFYYLHNEYFKIDVS